MAAHTIKADGSIVELDKKTVYKRDLVRSGGRSSKVVFFAIPAVEVGAIVEYRWRQTEKRKEWRRRSCAAVSGTTAGWGRWEMGAVRAGVDCRDVALGRLAGIAMGATEKQTAWRTGPR